MTFTKALIICGSNSKESKSFEIAQTLSKELSLWTIYLNSYDSNVPLLNNHLINEKKIPPSISFLSEKILEHNILLFVFPQYNYNFSGFFKNILDWCSLHTKKLFYKKRVILIGVSSTNIGEEEFKKIVSWTFYSLGAEDIHFFNKTPNINLMEFIKEMKKYV
ncbi:NAD(P)H-dependent oxidoreductase [Mycoplasma parvum]|uniref:NADPH-dependent FMN reductase-like domain-containing protein n=1 Tax=Mycoplasma parvum str. Indiana TaxID=1403316 RepID=U5NCX4_9MOLU|nr:NADPH-dependent FMN reductase [Mycoplasma parvum]AGX89190.1 hypothetical protein PRV_02260 [Mycoplasma parvum str. Indiana]